MNKVILGIPLIVLVIGGIVVWYVFLRKDSQVTGLRYDREGTASLRAESPPVNRRTPTIMGG